MRSLLGDVAQVDGIPPCARSSKRTVRLISGVALDECLDLERYQTRAPFRSVVEGVRIDEELARKASVVHPIALGFAMWS